jgi:hypothetical protein
MKQQLSKWLASAALFGFAAGVIAAPYSVTYTDTATTSDTLPANIIAGQQFTVKFVFDNGNSTAANQSWSAGNVQCAIFTFNNAQNVFLAINVSTHPFTSSTVGNFTTDGTGHLQAGAISWFDDGPIANPQVSNVSGFSGGANAWFINGGNDVVNFNATNVSVGMATVANNDQVANWTNPVPAAGVCAGFFGAPAQSQNIPTLSEWGVIMLSTLLGFGAVLTLRRKRQ